MRILLAALLGQACFPQDLTFFSEKVYPALEAVQCRACHTRDGVASATRLQFPEKDAAEAQVRLFGLSLAPVGRLLIDKPTNRARHTGGERIEPGSPQEKLLERWVNMLAPLTEPALAALRSKLGAPTSARPNQLVRRLTHSQYNNTVRDLLGDFSRPAQRFPTEDYVDGFKNQLRNQSMPPLLIETYSTAAEKLALNAFRAGDVQGLIPCKPASAADAACRDRFIGSFGLRAFRRPLGKEEIARYRAAFDGRGDFLEGARAVVEAMLQSPKFLFHLEAGPDGRAVDHAIASRLSYLLWDSMPDAALLEEASKGVLRSAAGRERAALRLIDSPRFNESLDEFFNQWLRLDRLPTLSKERRRFPEFSSELAAAMGEETRLLLRHLVGNGRNFMELLTADYGFLSSDLASLYGLPAPGGQFELVKFPAGSARAGFLGQGAFLAAMSGPLETSPTARGIFVREQLLCQHVPPPPPGVDTNLPDPTEEKPSSRRQRLAAHVENAACASCHKLMDPIGFGLEGFDALGRWREKETILVHNSGNEREPAKKFELPVETGGEIAGLPGSAFTDARKLGAILAASPVCQECIVRQYFRYAFGRKETAADQETIAALFRTFRDSGFRFKDLVMAVVRSPELVRGLDDN